MSGGTRSYEMARRLVSMGHEVTLVTSWRNPSHNSDWFVTYESGIKVFWLPIPYSNKMGYLRRLYSFFRFAFEASFKACSIDSDIVFATSTPLTIAIPAVLASRFRGIPMVFEVRDLWPEMPIAIKALTNPLLISLARKLEFWAYRNSS